MLEGTSAPPKSHLKKVVRKVSASSTNLRARAYVRRSTSLFIDDPSQKAGTKRARKRVVRVVGARTSMFEDPEEAAEEEEEEEIPTPPDKKLMVDAMPKKSASKTDHKAKKTVDHRKTTKDIPAAAKKKRPATSAPTTEEEVDEDATILRKLRPHLPIHNDASPIAEDTKKRRMRV